MADVTITQEDDGRHGRYVARIAGIGDEAELTFTHRGPGLVSADHTGAPESMRGTGAAAALVDFLIADARHSGFRSEEHPSELQSPLRPSSAVFCLNNNNPPTPPPP